MHRAIAVLVTAVLIFFANPVSAQEVKKKEFITSLRRLFSTSPEVSWSPMVRLGPEKGLLVGACEALKSFQNRIWAIDEMKKREVTWQDLRMELSEKEMRQGLVRQATDVTHHLLKVLGLSLTVRDGQYCSDQIPDFGDAIAVIEEVIRVLESVGLEPKHTQTTGDVLRGIVLIEVRRQVEVWRAGDRDPDGFTLIFCQGAYRWNFPADELGLTLQEKAMVAGDIRMLCGQ